MGYSLQELADRFDCDLQGDGLTIIETVCTLHQAKPKAISFLANPRYRHYLSSTDASAVIIQKQDASNCQVPALLHDNPYACYARIAQFLIGEISHAGGIHPTSIVDERVKLGKNVFIGAHSVIGQGTLIGDNTYIGSGCVISDNVEIGSDSYLHANITVYKSCIVGKRSIVHAGVVIGADGFGIAQDQGKWVKVPQTGRVIIGDDVEIGASTTIDRGAIEDTIIEDGVKLDNQIQIGHNVRIGAHTAIAGCVGIAGSAEIGERCTIAAMTLVLGHLKLANDVHITAQSMVTKSIDEPGIYSSGTPLQENALWKRNFTRFGQLDDIAKRLSNIEKQLDIK